MKKTLILQQDDCAPDALEFFLKDFEKMFSITLQEFKKQAVMREEDGGYEIIHAKDDIEVTIEAGDPWYKVYRIERE